MDDIVNPIEKEVQSAMRKRAKARFAVETHERDLLLVYSPKNGAEFIDEFVIAVKEEELRRTSHSELSDWKDPFLHHDEEGNPYISIASGAFHFYISDIVDSMSDDKNSRTFRLGTLCEDGYYVLPKKILGIKDELKIHSSIKIDILFFLTPVCNLPILQKIDKIIKEPIVVGGDAPNAIDQGLFVDALRSVPTRWELAKYVDYRVEKVVQDFFESTTDEEGKYQRYLRKHVKHPINRQLEALQEINKQELQKFIFLKQRIEVMLSEPDLSESEWQRKILEFILLLFPRYIQVLDNVEIKEKVGTSKIFVETGSITLSLSYCRSNPHEVWAQVQFSTEEQDDRTEVLEIPISPCRRL